MPKVRRARSLSSVRSRSSPYAGSSNHSGSCKSVNSESAQDVKEWEEARCPICMEHPHNAVLLKCSSHDKGCRPYMCNNSYRHSNCFEQFCKLYGPIPLATQLQENNITSVDCVASHRQMDERSPVEQNGLCGNQLQSELICPLCRGDIYGYLVVQPARQFMNSKVRSCSSELCDFSGAYSELRKHARSEHPYVRPAEVDPVRHHDWVRLQRDRDFEDLLSLVQSDHVEGIDEDYNLRRDVSFWMSSFASEMFDSLMDHVMDALRDMESLHERMENAQRDLDSLETRHHSLHTRWHDLRSSQQTPRAIQLHRQNHRQSAAAGTSQSQNLRWRSYTSSDRHQRSFESTSRAPQPRRQHGNMSNSIPHASRLRWRNHRWSSSSYHNER